MPEVISLEEFHRRLKAQGVPSSTHYAFVCPMCKTVQSMALLRSIGVPEDRIGGQIAFSCVGRWTDAGPHKRNAAPGKGCDWTLGGLLTIHRLEVETADGVRHPRFELATPEQAQELCRRLSPAPEVPPCA